MCADLSVGCVRAGIELACQRLSLDWIPGGVLGLDRN